MHAPAACANFDAMGDCAHTHQLLCKLKGGAFWWMMARLAGWDGQPMQTVEPYKIASIPNPMTNQTVTYKIVLQGLNFSPTTTVRLTDVIPADLAYISGTLTATAGSVTATTPVMLWSGTLSTSPAVTITYATKVTTTAVSAIVNTAQVSAPGYTILNLKTMIIANGYSAYMPVLLK